MQPENEDGGDDGQFARSVSSLASRFEQLAASSGVNRQDGISATGPPSKPVKPHNLRSTTSRSQIVSNKVVPEAPIRSALSSGSSLDKTAQTESFPGLQPPNATANAGKQETSAQNIEEAPSGIVPVKLASKAASPPPVPSATRPAVESSASSASNLLTAPAAGSTTRSPSSSPSRKRSRTPPPVPQSRHASRPPSPYLSPPQTTESEKTQSSTDPAVPASVASLAARFGAVTSRSSTPVSVSMSEGVAQARSPRTSPKIAETPKFAMAASSSRDQNGNVQGPDPLLSDSLQSFVRYSSSPVDSQLGPRLQPSASIAEGSRPSVPPPITAPRPILGNATPILEAQMQSQFSSSSSDPVAPALPARKTSEPKTNSSTSSIEDAPSSKPPELPTRTTLPTPVPPTRPRSTTLASSRSPLGSVLPTASRRDTVSVASNKTAGGDKEPYLPPPPPTRNLAAGEVPSLYRSSDIANKSSQDGVNNTSSCGDSESDEAEEEPSDLVKKLREMPDASFANRRPPKITPERNVTIKHSINSIAVCGRYAVTASSHLRVWDTFTGESINTILLNGSETRVTAVEFVHPYGHAELGGTLVWAGTKDGHLFEVNLTTNAITSTKLSAHSHPVVGIYLSPGNIISTVCDAGKVQIWQNDEDQKLLPTLSMLPRTQRMGDKYTFVQMMGMQLWSSQGPARHHTPSHSSAATRSPAIRVYDVSPDAAFNLTNRSIYLPDTAGPVGAVLSGTFIPSQPDIIYLAHESGHVSIWEKKTLNCMSVLRISTFSITAIQGVLGYLWTGNREGTIHIYDINHSPWKAVKAWKGMAEPIIGLQVDIGTIALEQKVHVASWGRESAIFWDGLLKVDWLEHALLEREAEFCSYRKIKVHICSWNIDSCKPADLQGDPVNVDFLSNALRASINPAITNSEPPEIIVFGFQEVVDLENKKVTAKSMLLGKKKADQLFQDQVSHQYMRWHDRIVQAVRTAMPTNAPYTMIHGESMVGLLTCILVRNSEKANISDLVGHTVKTGMGGRYGNKGAICARFVMDDSSICFANCHLAAGQRGKRQRNQDLIDILENKSAFLQPSSAVPGVYVGGNGQTVFEHEICFLSGDLNYRIDLTRSIVNANIRSNNLSLLLEHDQLLKEMKTNQGFRLRSFKEAPITFLPTYKFDPGTDNYDSSAKERIPAWCDRILFRTAEPSKTDAKITALEYRSWPANPSDHKPITGLFEVRIKRINQDLRNKIWEEADKAWKEREKTLLLEAKRVYS